MEINLIIFGKLIDITGSAAMTIKNVADTAQLNEQLHSRYPALSSYPYVIAVEQEIVHANTPLKNKDTVALLPPYAGG
ncbi:MAG: thiamine protein [Chitinophagaceae bacterium]|nr:thiamine protein [Chitinophagaceae bacterium]